MYVVVGIFIIGVVLTYAYLTTLLSLCSDIDRPVELRPVFQNNIDYTFRLVDYYTKDDVLQFFDGHDANVRQEKFNLNKGGGGTDVSRLIFTMEIAKYVADKTFNHLLLINEGDMARPHLMSKSDQITVHRYHVDKHGKVSGDMHDLYDHASSTYDIIYAPQTFEHILDPKVAIGELKRILVPGGCVIATQPFYTRIHMQPHFYYTYSPYGLNAMFQSNGFSVKDVACWGTAEYIRQVIFEKKWPKLRSLTESLKTTKDTIAQCMVIACKK